MKLNLTALSQDELRSKARECYSSIIGDQSRRMSHDFEDRTICVLLGAASHLLEFPFQLTGTTQEGDATERPDFRIHMAGTKIGIEITKAANRDFEWAKAIAMKKPGAVLEPCLFGPDEQIERGQGRQPPVSKMTQPLYGPGWQGYAVEEEWSTYITRSIREKTAKLSEESFGKLDEDWLLVYDSTPVRMFLHEGHHLEVGMQMLQKKLGHDYWSQPIVFGKIFIECTDRMVLLERSGWNALHLPSWKPA